jgi:hypothetical protein
MSRAQCQFGSATLGQISRKLGGENYSVRITRFSIITMLEPQPCQPDAGERANQPLPELRQALLSPEEVRALAADLLACTQLGEVLEKTRDRSHADGQPSLSAAIERLLDGRVTGMQVRYRYQDQEWTDTLMAASGGFRLVRCQHI